MRFVNSRYKRKREKKRATHSQPHVLPWTGLITPLYEKVPRIKGKKLDYLRHCTACFRFLFAGLEGKRRASFVLKSEGDDKIEHVQPQEKKNTRKKSKGGALAMCLLFFERAKEKKQRHSWRIHALQEAIVCYCYCCSFFFLLPHPQTRSARMRWSQPLTMMNTAFL